MSTIAPPATATRSATACCWPVATLLGFALTTGLEPAHTTTPSLTGSG